MSKDSINYFLIQEAEKLLIVEKEFKAAIRFPFIVGLTLTIVTKTKKVTPSKSRNFFLCIRLLLFSPISSIDPKDRKQRKRKKKKKFMQNRFSCLQNENQSKIQHKN